MSYSYCCILILQELLFFVQSREASSLRRSDVPVIRDELCIVSGAIHPWADCAGHFLIPVKKLGESTTLLENLTHYREC